MVPIHGQTTYPARTAFLRTAERHDLTAGIGLAQLALWYASEGIPFEESVSALAERAGADATAARVAYECLAFTKLSHSSHTQVMALFMVSDLRSQVESASRPETGLTRRLVAALRRLRQEGD